MADTLIKQQLSSLSYVRAVCDTRQQQLSDGSANTDCVLPGVRTSVVVFVPLGVVLLHLVVISFVLRYY